MRGGRPLHGFALDAGRGVDSGIPASSTPVRTWGSAPLIGNERERFGERKHPRKPRRESRWHRCAEGEGR
jgi:hypothetical protein